MTSRETVETQLPFLRRYARSILGSQEDGDAAVKATLEAMVAEASQSGEPHAPGQPLPPARLALYRTFHRVNGRAFVIENENTAADDPTTVTELPMIARQILLLTAVEGFGERQVGEILDLSLEDVEAWLVRARETLAPSLQARVMIIEDETIIAWHLSEIVSELGCTVIGVVRTRAEAVAMAAQTEPELILADISLADRSSGLDAIRDILADRAVPAIFITAFPERLLTGERPEPTYLITKPFEPATVSATIWQALLVHRERERGRLPKVA